MYTLTVGVDCNALAALDFIKLNVPMSTPFRLRPYERVIQVQISGDRTVAHILVETFVVRESRTRTVFLKKGKRATSYALGAGNVFHMSDDPLVIWDDSFVRTDHVEIGRVETADETKARREYEADAYRVGSAKNPLDNASRTADAFAHPTMTKYWSA